MLAHADGCAHNSRDQDPRKRALRPRKLRRASLWEPAPFHARNKFGFAAGDPARSSARRDVATSRRRSRERRAPRVVRALRRNAARACANGTLMSVSGGTMGDRLLLDRALAPAL